ncbi:repetitive proline-rich cell wall protein 1 [Fusarium langsethiae]|uniref:Repetitive proline-rich cell wall protein 1 n=1 Tax=Fusarium langsethiae TaxID=179993 RepID=A0A0M9EZ93_FUSLA|nr:repetitive proline-rich cell wall protein 1 [Fusarium langsethiae]GKU05175.1 unnamed protein product [Fusarium langsethiae]GKU19740.1 unnamed protein product [Fusarium langsethiae]
MLLPSIVGAVGLLGTVAEAAPRGSWFGRAQPRFARFVNDYAPPKYTPINSYMPSKNTTTPVINSTTLEPTIQCPTNFVFVSIKTVDVTVTVTASSDGSRYTTEICKDCTKTVTISNTVLVPPTKYASTLPYGEENTGSPYYPVNSTYAAPSQPKTSNDYPYMNSTIEYSFTTPIDQHASPTYQTLRQSAVYSTPDGQVSPPVYTKAANTKPVYSDATCGNSTGTPSGYVPPVYTKPAYSSLASGNGTVPVDTKPVDTPVYSAPVYTQPVLPRNTSVVTPPVYTKPAETSVYSVPVYTKPVLPSNSSIVDPPVYTKPVSSEPIIPGNSSTTDIPVDTKPIETPIYTPPVYTKPVSSEPIIPGNSSTTDIPVDTKPVETPIYTPPVYTEPADPGRVIPDNSSTVEPPVISSTTDNAIYTPPVYNPPVISSESS